MRGLRKVGAIVALGLASILPSERIGTLENILSPPFSIAQNIGDGSNEPGYVSPPTDSKQIAPPPANMSGGESFIPYPPPPAAPQSRSEKKNPPKPATMFTKITDDQYDSNARPADLDVLCKELKAKANVDYSWETKRLEEVSPDPDNNPILVYTKYNRYSFSETERKVLREFVLRGGTLILPPGGGSAPAYNSAVIESAKILPEASSQKISKDHPILHSYYDLDSVNVSFGNKVIEPEITISTVDCRAAIIIPKEGIDSCSGEFREGIDKVLLPEDAQKLGMNILAYASAERKWQESLKGEAVLQDKTDGLAGKLYVAQIIYNGEWKTRHVGLRKELAYFNQVSGVPVKFNQRDIRLTDKGLFDSQ